MSASSILRNSWRDEVGPAAALDRYDYAPGAKLLVNSNSRNNWGGFDQHFGGYLPDPPHGFTTMRAFPGETHSLLMSCGERPYVAGKGQRDRGTTLYSRLGWQPDSYKRLHLAATFTVLGADVWSWSSISLGFDIQSPDNLDRAHFRAQAQDPFSGDDGGLPLWKIAKNGTRNPDGSEADGGWATVPGSSGAMIGENENKGGWNFARLSIDLENIQAGSTHPAYVPMTPGAESLPDVPPVPDTIGRYLELQVNDEVVDLTGIAGVGQGWQKPQAPNPIGDFRSGCNPGIGAFRSTRNPTRAMNILWGPIYVVLED